MIPTIFIPGRREALRNYTAAIYSAGGMPICSTDSADSVLCGGLLLPGGGDIGKTLDEGERKLIQSFVQSRRPVFGICRGMQALNVYFGGTLYDFIPGHQVPDTYPVHPTTAAGLVAKLLGPAPVVNTNHHQAVERLGRGLVVCQHAADGVVEAICHASLPILALQWHPERQSFALRRADATDAAPIFYHFIRQARSQLCATSEN